MLDRGRIADAVGETKTCADNERSGGQHDSHDNLSHRAILALVRCVPKPKLSIPRAARRPSPTGAVIAPDLGRPEIGSSNAPNNRAMSGQRKHRELAAERRVVPQGGIAADGAQAGGGIR